MYNELRARIVSLTMQLGQDSPPLKDLCTKLREPETVETPNYIMLLELLVISVETVLRYKYSVAKARQYATQSPSLKNRMQLDTRMESLTNHKLVMEYRTDLVIRILDQQPYHNIYTGERTDGNSVCTV